MTLYTAILLSLLALSESVLDLPAFQLSISSNDLVFPSANRRGLRLSLNQRCLKSKPTVSMSATQGAFGLLSMLSVLKKLRCGDVREMKEVHFPGCINRSYKFICEKGSFFVKINDDFSAKQMFEGEAAGLQVSIALNISCKTYSVNCLKNGQ